MVARLRAIKAELRYRMHEPVASVGEWLQKVVVGYYRYHAVPGNTDRLRVFGQRLRRLWRLTLSRRSQTGMLPWDRLQPILDRWIPYLVFCILILIHASPPPIQGGSRMRKRARTVLVQRITLLFLWVKVPSAEIVQLLP